MLNLEIDIETFSSVNLAKAGVYRYAESPDFEVLLFGYSVDGGEVKVGDLVKGEKIPEEVMSALEDEAVTKWAFNAQFERICISRMLGYEAGTYLVPASWKCSMVWSAYMGLALHWEHRLKNAVNRYNSIFRVQLPKITPHICRHTYCSNQAKAGMNPKTLQYLMGHSDIGVTMNTYTHLSLDDAKNEMIRMEELEQARKEVDKAEDKKPMKQNMFKVV